METMAVVIWVFFVPAALIVSIILRNDARKKRYQLQSELYSKALEKGQTLPTEWFVEPTKKHNWLNMGLICTAIGIGISLSIWVVSALVARVPTQDATIASKVILSFSSIGIIPFLIGIAFVIIHFIEKRKATNENAK